MDSLESAPNSAASVPRSGSSRCRFCSAPLQHSFVDLGMSPLCQTHIAEDQINSMERFFPLHALICEQCLLVQLDEFVAPDEIFSEYAYFSSYSDSWVRHAREYCESMVGRFGLTPDSQVMEIASNDGYLLQHFVARGIPVLGIEPAANVAQTAVEKGVPTEVAFLGKESAGRIVETHGHADLVVGNNVLAHVPDINDFVSGIGCLLAQSGIVTMEFPHLYQLINLNQFDTIYHEHFSYLSFYTVEKVFKAHGLTIFDVEEIETHGGSLRIYARHEADVAKQATERVASLHAKERADGFHKLERYLTFEDQVRMTKRGLLEFLIRVKNDGKRIVGYGAPGKGNTLLNYCGIRTDFLDFTVDRNPYKQGKLTPGTHIPILDPSAIFEARPDYVLILPWNLEHEVQEQMAEIREWGGRFVVPIPSVHVV